MRLNEMRQLKGKGTKDYVSCRDEILEKQNKRCAICGEVPQVPQLEHDHKTWQIRGVTCAPCNILLGAIESN